MKDLLHRYLNDDISKEEQAELLLWLNNPSNKLEFEKLIKTRYDIERALIPVDTDRKFHELLERLNLEETTGSHRVVKHKRWFSYAALVLVIVSTAIVVQLFTKKTPDLASAQKPEESITIEMEDGSVRRINETEHKTLLGENGEVIGEQDSTVLEYKPSQKKDQLSYNTLRVPFGKHFELRLSDGTNVYMNAGSSLTYPVEFISGTKRSVKLSGEAYFRVNSNDHLPFVVSTSELDVTVWGTEFNVNAYSDEPATNVVLVEGKVSLSAANDSTPVVLSPGMKGSLLRNSPDAGIELEDVDPNQYTAWMGGRLVFRSMPFRQIVNRLERQYNVNIRCENDAMGEELFSGTLDDEGVEKVLSYFKTLYAMDYTVERDTIIIKPQKLNANE